MNDNTKIYTILVRFKTEKERKQFKLKSLKNNLTYREAINEWVNQ